MLSQLVFPQAHAHINQFGKGTVGTTQRDVWDVAGQDIWLAPTAARVHQLVSSDVNDDGDPAGTGARTVRVYGLTSWSAIETSEVIIMNGTTNVATTNSYVIIHRMVVETFGASGPNVGDITATADTDATITAQINAGVGKTAMAIYGFPSGITLALKKFQGAILHDTSGRLSLFLYCAPDPENQPAVFALEDAIGAASTGSSSTFTEYCPWLEIAGPAIVKVQGDSQVVSNIVTTRLDGLLVRT